MVGKLVSPTKSAGRISVIFRAKDQCNLCNLWLPCIANGFSTHVPRTIVSTEKKITVILVDDHHIVLDGLKSLLESDSDFVIMGALRTAEDALEMMKQKQPSILMTDYSLPGLSGLELTKHVRIHYPDVKIVVLSMHDEASVVRSVLKEGVDGYLLKNIQQFELRNALKQIALGMKYVSPEITKLIMAGMSQPAQEPELLTLREREILRLIAQENSNKQIAEKLFISERTVETHRKNILRKTNTNSVIGLIKYAYEHNLI